MFSHEKLQVYAKSMEFTGKATALASLWDKKHAVADQLSRAAESIVLNLAEAARQRAAPVRPTIVDYAIGSSLECAGCLDIARIKDLPSQLEWYQEKSQLSEVTKMLIGLRKAWSKSIFKEEPIPYRSEPSRTLPQLLFHHESLEVYQAALTFMAWFVSQPGAKELPNPLRRRIDEAATSAVLNIAEGNGRYAELDQQRFLKLAQSAVVKAAIYLDLAVEKSILARDDAGAGKEILRRVNAMLSRF